MDFNNETTTTKIKKTNKPVFLFLFQGRQNKNIISFSSLHLRETGNDVITIDKKNSKVVLRN